LDWNESELALKLLRDVIREEPKLLFEAPHGSGGDVSVCSVVPKEHAVLIWSIRATAARYQRLDVYVGLRLGSHVYDGNVFLKLVPPGQEYCVKFSSEAPGVLQVYGWEVKIPGW
jgi:hypothetical protein